LNKAAEQLVQNECWSQHQPPETFMQVALGWSVFQITIPIDPTSQCCLCSKEKKARHQNIANNETELFQQVTNDAITCQ